MKIYENNNNNTLTFNMTFKCPFCLRTFSNRSACTQHINYCLPPDHSSSEESDLVTDINDMSLESENLSPNIDYEVI